MRILTLLLLLAAAASAEDIRVGMIGLDTSHAIAFTKILNDPANEDHVAGARVVAAFPGGSPDLASSRDRVEGYTKQLREDWQVEIVDSIPALLDKVDAVLLESVDGRVHLEQVTPVFEAGKPVFIDKPLAASYEDARAIDRLATEHDAAWWSSSSLRYSPMVEELRLEGLTGAITWGPAPLEPTHELDLSWYGIHPVELLYAILGPGCTQVRRLYTPEADVIVGEWSDGRTGVVRTIREGESGYGAVAFGGEAVKMSDRGGAAYSAMLGDVVEFFKTGQPPVPNEETLEIFGFLEAARLSREQNGAAVPLP